MDYGRATLTDEMDVDMNIRQDQLAAKGGSLLRYHLYWLLAIAYANRGGIPPITELIQPYHPLWPDILTIPRGNPDTKKHVILLNSGP